MLKAFDFCLPTKCTTVPSGPDCLHEVKYAGYRLGLERDGDRVRSITRGGYTDGNDIAKLPKHEHDAPEWRAAVKAADVCRASAR